jgi:hypothetical protein
MFRLQKSARCFRLLVFLLVISLGAGGLVLCVRKDGQSKVNHAFNRCHECNPNSACGATNCASSSQKSGSTSGCSCGKRVSCHKVPIVLITSARTSARILSFSPVDSPAPCISLEAAALLPLCAWAHTAMSRSSGPCRPSSESLRSTILII